MYVNTIETNATQHDPTYSFKIAYYVITAIILIRIELNSAQISVIYTIKTYVKQHDPTYNFTIAAVYFLHQ